MEYAKDKKIRKMIRISPEENDNWDIVKIHEFLQNKLPGDNNDTEILKKMIPAFIKYGVKLETTTEMEDKRIMELIEKCL